MRDVLGKMRECGKYIKMRDFPHNCGMVDTYDVECLAIMNHVFHVMHSLRHGKWGDDVFCY